MATTSPLPAGRITINGWDAVALFLPLLRFVSLPFGGQLLGPEILLLLLSPLLIIATGRRLFSPLPALVFVLAATWLIAQIISDFINGTPPADLVRGWAKIAFIFIDFSALYLLLNERPKRLVLFAVGLVLGGLLQHLLNPSELGMAYPWKFGLSTPISIATVLLCVWLNTSALGRLLGVVLLIGLGSVNFYLDFRSMAGFLILVAVLQLVPLAKTNRHGPGWLTEFGRATVLFMLLAGSSAGVVSVYQLTVEAGLLGEAASSRYEQQASGAYGLLLGGRSEILASSQAILDAPLWGHGSWAKDCRYSDLLLALKSDLGYDAIAARNECRIPSHSHILGAWVEAGVLGGLFWIVLMFLPVRALILLSLAKPRITPVAAFFALQLIWDLMFSPYGGELRYRTPYELVFMMTIIGFLQPRLIAGSPRGPAAAHLQQAAGGPDFHSTVNTQKAP